MAGAIDATGYFDRLPILADALEEAGCTSEVVLRHCRDEPTHVRGCWVIDNLLGNAAKFTPPDSPVELNTTTDDVSTTMTVRDHGNGVEQADLGLVFERFYRATSARTLPGSGLGLAIVHDTVATHGGTVTVANHPDGGAVVTVVLPNHH